MECGNPPTRPSGPSSGATRTGSPSAWIGTATAPGVEKSGDGVGPVPGAFGADARSSRKKRRLRMRTVTVGPPFTFWNGTSVRNASVCRSEKPAAAGRFREACAACAPRLQLPENGSLQRVQSPEQPVADGVLHKVAESPDRIEFGAAGRRRHRPHVGWQPGGRRHAGGKSAWSRIITCRAAGALPPIRRGNVAWMRSTAETNACRCSGRSAPSAPRVEVGRMEAGYQLKVLVRMNWRGSW